MRKTTIILYLSVLTVFFIAADSFAQDCNEVKAKYEKEKYYAITYLFDKNVPVPLIDDRILNSPCINYYILALGKTKSYNNLYKTSDAIANKEVLKSSKKNAAGNTYPDSVISSITSLYKPAAQVTIMGSDMGNISSWLLTSNSLNKEILSELYNFYKLNRYELSVFGTHSTFLTSAARTYIWNYGLSDPQSLEMFDMLNSIYKQSASGKFFPAEVKTKEEYDEAIKNELLFRTNYSTLNLGNKFNFVDVPLYANRLYSDKNVMLEWYKNAGKIEKMKVEKLDFYYRYFSNNHHYYQAAVAYTAKLSKGSPGNNDYASFFEVLSKMPSQMFPQANQTFQSTLDRYYEFNKNSCSFQRDYIGFLSNTEQFEKGITHINSIKSEFPTCMSWDSLLLEFRISKIFNSVDITNDPIKVFQTSIEEKIPFNRINKKLEFYTSLLKAKTLGQLFFSLYNKSSTYRDSIRWGFCDQLFPGSPFKETELNQFLAIYKNLKMTEMVDLVNYDLWYGKSHNEIMEAIKSKKISPRIGWQIIGEYGIYYYSESENRNSTETKNTALNMMKQAAVHFPQDGELQKHIGHCLFLLGRSAEAQPYYKRAQALGANMTDVGAYGGTGVRTGPRGGKHVFKISPGTVNSQKP